MKTINDVLYEKGIFTKDSFFRHKENLETELLAFGLKMEQGGYFDYKHQTNNFSYALNDNIFKVSMTEDKLNIVYGKDTVRVNLNNPIERIMDIVVYHFELFVCKSGVKEII
jgi:hypothetical protein